MHLSSSVHARNQYPSLCHITPKALSTSIGLHTAAGTNRRSTRALDKMQHISENDAATPQMVDRATFQPDVDALRTREKAHMREGAQIAAARGRLQIGRAHVSTAVTHAHLVCRAQLDKKQHTFTH